MKTQLIKIQDKFILVNDEAIKEGDTALDLCEDMGTKFESFIVDKATLKYANQECKLIISENPDFSLLSEEDCKIIGFIDVDKIYHEISDSYFSEKYEDPLHYYSFYEGFKKAQYLNDKIFSLEVVKKAYREGFKQRGEPKSNNAETFFNSLQQTSWDVEVNENNQITKIL